MTNFVTERRQQLREDGLEALGVIVQAIQSHPGAGQVGKIVRFVAGCYNSSEYPFEIDLLRSLDTKLAAACVTYLAYDALGEEEIHHHIPSSGETVNRWFEEYGIKPVDPSIKGLDAKSEVVALTGKLVTYGHSTGYRDAHFVFDVTEVLGHEKRRIDVRVNSDDAATIRAHINYVHRTAWEGKGPIDLKEGEQRPKWL